MKTTSILSVCAGLSLGMSAIAQDTPLEIQQIAMPPPPGGYFSERALVVVWGAEVYSSNGGYHTYPPPRVANDFDFAGGPAGGVAGGVHLIGAYFAFYSPPNATMTRCDVRVSVYSTFGGWIDSTFPGSNLVGQATYPNIECPPNTTRYLDSENLVPVEFGTVPNVPGTDGLFMVELFQPGTNDLHPTAWIPATLGSSVRVGRSDPVVWADGAGPGALGEPDGLVQAYWPGGQAMECNLPTDCCGGRAFYGGLWGEVEATPPQNVEDLGCLADGITTRAVTIAPHAVKWYRICLTNGAEDDTLRYLDIDSEGPGTVLDMCLYDSQGNIVGYPGTFSGSGYHAQISCGVGRRAPIGNGIQYDGRMGQLERGVYYLAVTTGFGGFRPMFAVQGGSPPSANGNVNFRTNINAGVIGPSVPPRVNSRQFGVLTPGQYTNSNGGHWARSPDGEIVRWSQFTLTNCVSSAGGYLDFNFSLTDAFTDSAAWIFDSKGDIVAFSDDVGGQNRPQFSFGVASPARQAPNGSTQPFAGQDGDLPAGTYYIATAIHDAANSDLSSLPSGHRWHVRGAVNRSGGVGFRVNYALNSAEQCPFPECDSIDFNNDDSLLDPVDIDAFLSVFSEGPCVPANATCNDIDFNNDTSLFDPCDISSFLTRYSEGPCTLCGI